MSRQMEYDADSYESIACGSDSFKDASLQLQKLGVAANKVDHINNQAWYENKLLRDYATATNDLCEQLSNEEIQYIKDHMHNLETNSWDSHPADSDRIAHVEKRNDKGFFFNETSARNFCKDFNNLSERATRYQYTVGKIANIDQYIIDNEQILTRHIKLKEDSLSLETFFAGTFNKNELLSFDESFKLDSTKNEWKSDWQETINNLRYKLDNHKKQTKQINQIIMSMCQQKVGRTFVEIGVRIEEDDFCLADNQPTYADLDHDLKPLQIKHKEFHELFQKRIAYAIHAAYLSSSLSEEDIDNILADYIFVTELSAHYQTLDVQFQLAWVGHELMSMCPNNTDIQSNLELQMAQDIKIQLWEKINTLWDACKALPDRVDNPNASLLDHVESVSGKRIKSIDSVSTNYLVNRAYQVNEAICYQNSNVLAQLADTCLKIEKEHGIKPIDLDNCIT